jgi:hypothetical protein
MLKVYFNPDLCAREQITQYACICYPVAAKVSENGVKLISDFNVLQKKNTFPPRLFILEQILYLCLSLRPNSIPQPSIINIMKKLFLLLLLTLSLSQAFAQELADRQKKLCATFGILQGGGSLIGADLEVLAFDRVGFQAGAGFVGFGGGLNIHLKPTIRSSFVSLAYWHQGVGDSYTQSVMGPSFVYRGKKWFTAQLGLGFALEKGPNWPKDREQPPVMLLYSIGAYIPW